MARFDAIMPAVYEAQRLLGLNNRELGDLLGVSKRTVQRWIVAGAGPSALHLQKLAAGLSTLDPELARQLDDAANATFEALGIAPAPPPPRARASSAGREDQLDAILIAAANAIDLSPRAVAPALAAALRRAFELGVDPTALLPLLERKPDR